MSQLPQDGPLAELQRTVLGHVVSEPGDWTAVTIAEDLDLELEEVEAAVRRLRDAELVYGRRPTSTSGLWPTEAGRQALGLVLKEADLPTITPPAFELLRAIAERPRRSRRMIAAELGWNGAKRDMAARELTKLDLVCNHGSSRKPDWRPTVLGFRVLRAHRSAGVPSSETTREVVPPASPATEPEARASSASGEAVVEELEAVVDAPPPIGSSEDASEAARPGLRSADAFPAADDHALIAAIAARPGERGGYYRRRLGWESTRLKRAQDRCRYNGVIENRGERQRSEWHCVQEAPATIPDAELGARVAEIDLEIRSAKVALLSARARIAALVAEREVLRCGVTEL